MWQVGCEVSRLWLAGVAIIMKDEQLKRENAFEDLAEL